MPNSPKRPQTIPTTLIAPCGMNCRLCIGFVRDRNRCPGCRSGGKPNSKWACKITTCDTFASGRFKYCFQCGDFPCARLQHLDKRYRTRYAMSMIKNLESISRNGVRQFIRDEKARWTCPGCGQLLCVHKPACLNCGHEWR